MAACDGGAGPTDVVDIPSWRLALIAVLASVPLAASALLRLGLHQPLLLGAGRSVAQLLLLGEVLRLLFTTDNFAWVVGYLSFMLAVATLEAVSRPSKSYEGMARHVTMAMSAPAAVTVLYMLLVIIRPPGRWYEPQYSVPLMGMVLGNSLNGVTIGMKSLLEAASLERASIEWALAMGATRYEAVWPVLQGILRTALTPVINMLMVAGLVSIPGMMTGQILGGSDAVVAAKYQIMILFGISAAGTTACLLALGSATVTLLDEQHRLRLDRLCDNNVSILLHTWMKLQGAAAHVASAVRGRWSRGARGYAPVRGDQVDVVLDDMSAGAQAQADGQRLVNVRVDDDGRQNPH